MTEPRPAHPSPASSRDEAVVEAIEAIDAIPDGDRVTSIRVWQYAESAPHSGKWAWVVVQEHESGSGATGRGDGNVNRRLAKMTLIRGDNEWPKR